MGVRRKGARESGREGGMKGWREGEKEGWGRHEGERERGREGETEGGKRGREKGREENRISWCKKTAASFKGPFKYLVAKLHGCYQEQFHFRSAKHFFGARPSPIQVATNTRKMFVYIFID